MKAVTLYEARGYHKFAEEDHFEQGCLTTGGTYFVGSDYFKAPTLKALIAQLAAHVPFTVDGDAIQLDACDEDGRVDITGYEDADGCSVSDSELEQWKLGNFRVWYVTYSFQVERVTRETVALSEVIE